MQKCYKYLLISTCLPEHCAHTKIMIAFSSSWRWKCGYNPIIQNADMDRSLQHSGNGYLNYNLTSGHNYTNLLLMVKLLEQIMATHRENKNELVKCSFQEIWQFVNDLSDFWLLGVRGLGNGKFQSIPCRYFSCSVELRKEL